MRGALSMIEEDLQGEVKAFQDEGKILEAQRLKQRTEHDLEMMREIGYCSGIENYSRYFDGRSPGEPSFTLLDYFPKGEFLVFIDESHMTIPQIRASARYINWVVLLIPFKTHDMTMDDTVEGELEYDFIP